MAPIEHGVLGVMNSENMNTPVTRSCGIFLFRDLLIANLSGGRYLEKVLSQIDERFCGHPRLSHDQMFYVVSLAQ